MLNKRMCGFSLLMIIACLAACGCGKSAPIKAVATREEIMHHLVIPNAAIVWGAVGTTSTLQGVEEKQPKTDDEWFNVEGSATALMETGNLLMMEGRALDSGKWMDWSKALRESADSVRQAAKKHDAAALFDKGGEMYESCLGCHSDFRSQMEPHTTAPTR